MKLILLQKVVNLGGLGQYILAGIPLYLWFAGRLT